jgi:hypothetical protein
MTSSSSATASLPRCSATPSEPSASEAAVAERFGEGIFAFGPFIARSAARHLDRERAKLTQGGDDAASSAAPPAVSEATLEEDLSVLKAASHLFELRAPEPGAPERSDEATRTLKSMLERCGGLERLDEAVYALLEHVETKVAGGLLHNWFRIGFWSDGSLGLHCASCAKECVLQFGNSGRTGSTSPFNNFTTRHLVQTGHEKARAAAIKEGAAHLIALVSSSGEASELQTEAHVAMQLFEARAAGLPGLEAPSAPHVELVPIGSEPRGPMTRSAWEAAQPELPATAQERLDARVGRGVYSVMQHETLGEVAVCQRCSRFNRTLIQLSNPNWIANAETHFRTHPDTRGMNTLDFYGVRGCTTRLCDVAAPASLDYGSVCHGYWLPQVVYDGTTYDATSLLQDWRPGKAWVAEPHFEATLSYERTAGQRLVCPPGSTITWRYASDASATGRVLGFDTSTCMFVRPVPESCEALQAAELLVPTGKSGYVLVGEASVQTVTYEIRGTYKAIHGKCGIFCIDRHTGEKRPNLMCSQCERVPHEKDFRERLLGRLEMTEESLETTRIDRLPTTPMVIAAARRTTQARKEEHWKLVRARHLLTRSRAQVASMRERLEASVLSDDLIGLQADLRICDQTKKFEGKSVLLNFIKDVREHTIATRASPVPPSC